MEPCIVEDFAVWKLRGSGMRSKSVRGKVSYSTTVVSKEEALNLTRLDFYSVI